MFSSGGRIRLVSGNNKSAMAVAAVQNLSSLDNDAKKKAMSDSSWIDGLRGIAAVFVVSSHVVLCFTRTLANSCCGENSDSPTLFQRPILHLVATGHSWVAMFFLLMGFVNALKPLKLARSGEAGSASDKLALSSFSRILRLVLPSTTATIISWLLCQLGLYRIAFDSDAYWLRTGTPQPSPNIWAAVGDLKDALVNTWALNEDNQYDQPQWALVYLLQGSMIIILFLLITVNMTPLWRTASMLIISTWSLNLSRHIRDPLVGLTCGMGIMFAELYMSNLPSTFMPYSTILSPPLVVFSLVMMSYPSTRADGVPWSNALLIFGKKYLPSAVNWSLDCTYGTLGGSLLVFSIMISPHARWLLSRAPLVWLGKISFPIYLIHGTVLRTVFAWALFWGQELEEFRVDNNLPYESYLTELRFVMPGGIRRVFATVVASAVILGLSHLWSIKMEPIFAHLTAKLERKVRGQKNEEGGASTLSEKDMVLPTRRD